VAGSEEEEGRGNGIVGVEVMKRKEVYYVVRWHPKGRGKISSLACLLHTDMSPRFR
jgi:hypothetical protein